MRPGFLLRREWCGARALRRGLAALPLALVAALATSVSAADRMLIVSWDGVARRVVRELVDWQPGSESPRACPSQRFPATMPERCGENWTCLPNLCRFQILDSWSSDGKPLTKPQHAQMLSGYGAATTGVARNNGSASMPEGYTIYERLKAARGAGIKTIHIAGRKYVSMGVVGQARKNGAIDVNARRGGPDLRTGANTTQRALPLIAQYAGGPFFFFLHYKEPDVTAHLSSVDSLVYREAVILVDKQLGIVLDALDKAGAMPGTAVLVTTDHGFTGRFHVSREKTNVETWIAALNIDLRTDRAVKLLDVTPTVLDYFGVPADQLDPPLEGSSLLHPVDTPVTTVTSTTTATTTTTTP
jgi:hypothetical protein